MFKLTFYKGYPWTLGGTTGGEYYAPALTSQNAWAAYLAQFEHFSTFENDGVFFDEQKEIYIEPFTAIDTCNYLKVDIDDGADVKYFFIDDIVRIPSASGATNDAARVTIIPDIITTDFYQPVSDSDRYSTPTMEGVLIQTQNATADTASEYALPIAPAYNRGATITPHVVYSPVSALFCLVATLSTEGGNIVTLIYSGDSGEGFTATEGAQNVRTIARTAQVKYITTGSGETSLNANILNLYILPLSWVSDIAANSYPSTNGSVSVSFVDIDNNIHPAKVFNIGDIAINRNGAVLVETLTPPVWSYTRMFFKTSKRETELAGVNNFGFLKIPIYMEVALFGSDTITITAYLNGEMVDITEDFLCDYAINQAALDTAQHKEAAAIRGITSVIGGIGSAIGAAMSGNYFGIVQSIAGTTEDITGQLSALKNPATATNAGSAASALVTFGLVCFYELSGASNQTQIQTEVRDKGYIYNSSVRRIIFYAARLSDATGNIPYYIRARNVRILGPGQPFGNAVAKQICELFERGIYFWGIS